MYGRCATSAKVARALLLYGIVESKSKCLIVIVIRIWAPELKDY